MANKQIDRSTFQELWEEIKMLNILRFAHEKGQQEGWLKGRIETAREMVISILEESFGVVPTYIADEIMGKRARLLDFVQRHRDRRRDTVIDEDSDHLFTIRQKDATPSGRWNQSFDGNENFVLTTHVRITIVLRVLYVKLKFTFAT